MLLHYLGPRFDNTYSAWKALGVEFPYYHIGDRRITVTDRRFQGMSPESFREEGLHFESMFESGNLDAVFKVISFLIRWVLSSTTVSCGLIRIQGAICSGITLK